MGEFNVDKTTGGLNPTAGMHLFCSGSVFFAAFIPIS